MRLHLASLDWPEPENGYQPDFSKAEGRTYETQMVHVDNSQFHQCRFVNCTFLYSGGPFGFSECEVEGEVRLSLTGAAHRALLLWSALQEQVRRQTPPY